MNDNKEQKFHLVFGPQGAGKTTHSKKLAKEFGAVVMSIDDWMWKLFGDDLPKSMNYNWIKKRVARCEAQIWSVSKQIVLCGGSVILDLGFMKESSRNDFIRKIQHLNEEVNLHYVSASREKRKERVLNRNVEKGSTFSFEVTSGMFDFMEVEFEPPTSQELDICNIVKT